MDVLRIRNSTAGNAENEEAKKYWGVISEHGDKPGPDPWTCLGLALYDFVRATTNAPPNPMTPAGAKTYATPEMMVQFKAMLGLDPGFSRDEAAYLDVYTIDELLTLELRVWKYETDMATRDGGPERGMPYITRDSFLTFLAYNAILHPETVRPRLNALIENKDKVIHLVDPLTNQPFPHLIPASSLASIYRPTLLESKATVEAANKPRIAKVMEARRAAAVAGGELRQFAPGGGKFTTLDFYDLAGEEAAAAQARALASMNSAAQSAVNIQNQAARNVAAISAANSELWGATQVAIAVSNGNAAQMAALF